VWRSGTVAMRSEARASASAAAKPSTTVTTCRVCPDGLGLVDQPAGQAPSGDVDVSAGCISGAGIFIPLSGCVIRLGMFRDPVLSAGLITSVLVSTVMMMTTLVAGPFHLSGALDLDPTAVGLVMSIGPLAAALISAPAGRAVDRLGAARMILIGLIGVLAGSIGLSSVPARWGVPGYVAPLVVITAGYALFQAANNTGVMSNVRLWRSSCLTRTPCQAPELRKLTLRWPTGGRRPPSIRDYPPSSGRKRCDHTPRAQCEILLLDQSRRRTQAGPSPAISCPGEVYATQKCCVGPRVESMFPLARRC